MGREKKGINNKLIPSTSQETHGCLLYTSHTGDSDNMAAASGDGGAAVLSADAAMALRNFESENNIREGVPDEM